MRDSKRKVLVTLLVVGVLGSLAAYGTFSAFSASTSNTGNSFAAGTVTIGDNDSNPTAAPMFNLSEQGPNTPVERCIKVTYGGSLPADVRLYTTTTPHSSTSNITLKIENGTTTADPTFPSC